MAPRRGFVKINASQRYLWRAMGHEGEVLERYVTKKHQKLSALRFCKKTMKRYGPPRKVVTDNLRSYGAAMRDIGNFYLTGVIAGPDDPSLFTLVASCHVLASFGSHSLSSFAIRYWRMLPMNFHCSPEDDRKACSILRSHLSEIDLHGGHGRGKPRPLCNFIPETAINGLAMVEGLSGLLFGAMTMLFFLRYNLTRHEVAEIQYRLKNKF